MTRFFPKSLFGQTLLILLVGLVISHSIGAWIYAGAREQAVRAIGGFAAAQRVANLSRLVEEAPADWRPRIVQALSDPTFRVALSAEPPEQLPADAEGAAAGDRGLCAPAASPTGPTARCGRRSLRRRAATRRALWPAVRSPAVSRADGRTGRHGRDDARHDGTGLRRLARPTGGGQAGRRPMAVVRHRAAAGRALGVMAIHYLHGADGRDRARGLGVGGAPRHRPARTAVGRRRSSRPRRGVRAARRGRHRRDAARRARVQPDAGTAAPADREPHPDAGGAVARSAHATDAAAPSHRGSRRCRRARQDAGDDRRDGRDDRLDTGFCARRGARRAAPARRHRRAARERRGRYGRRRTAGDHDAGSAADPRLPARRLKTRDHQSARQRGEVRQARPGGDRHRRTKRSRSPSTTTGQEFPRRNCRACSSRSTGSRIRAAATPAAPGWDWRSRNRSCRRMAASSRWPTASGGGLRACIKLPV